MAHPPIWLYNPTFNHGNQDLVSTEYRGFFCSLDVLGKVSIFSIQIQNDLKKKETIS